MAGGVTRRALLGSILPGGVLVDGGFPGGNIVVEGVEGDTVRLHQDLRDTEGDWFYWYFRVRGAAGRRLRFQFTRSAAIGARGPAVSRDGGRNWGWLGRSGEEGESFQYEFAAGVREARFCMSIPYMESDLRRFLARHAGSRYLRRRVLCRTKAGREAELLECGAAGGKKGKIVLLTARHHACESIASYALEGLLETVLGAGETGEWLRGNLRFLVAPFMDKDGVEEGDQGKNRRPRDHNRDYDGRSLYPSVAAIRRLGEGWRAGEVLMALDLHCPWLRGGEHEQVHFVGGPEPGPWVGLAQFGEVLERGREGPLPFRSADNLPFGKSWNTEKNTAAGRSFGRWAAGLAGVAAAGTLEIPYANAGGVEVTAESARALGRDLARSLREFSRGLV